MTWKNHLQQESEWEGSLWGKNADFIGKEQFGAGERKPRTLGAPGSFYEYNDVRINRFALSLLRVFDKPVPEVFQEQVMDVIGASNTWKWVPYTNSYVELNGKQVPSVSGGTRWGGGMWINSWDMARFGYLWLRGGAWNGRTVVPQRLREGSLEPEREWAGLRLSLVAQYQGQEPAGHAGHGLCRAGRGQQYNPGVAGTRPGDRLALAWRECGGVRQAGDCRDQVSNSESNPHKKRH